MHVFGGLPPMPQTLEGEAAVGVFLLFGYALFCAGVDRVFVSVSGFLGYIWDILYLFKQFYFWNIVGIFLGFAWDIFGIFLTYA